MLRSYNMCMVLVAISATGCGSKSYDSYDREVDLTVRAALDQITESERIQLFQDNHPILLQLADPALRGLMRMFAELPDQQHSELRDKMFLKWRFADLDRSRQQAFEQVLQMNADLLGDPAKIAEAERLVRVLDQCDVGFAVVEIPSSGERVVSCYMIWPNNLFPTWVTVANAKATRSKDSIDAHMARLPMLKLLSHSDLPPKMNMEAEIANPSASVTERSGVDRAAHRLIHASRV